MSKVIGIASEGPTDYLVLKMLIDRITGEENRYLRLQPEADMMGRYGNEFPLYCERSIAGMCLVELPCQSHFYEIKNVINHGMHVLNETISISDKSRVIITIPCDSTDAWIVAAYDDYDEIEKIEDPWRNIIAKRKYYHDVRVRGEKKSINTYTIFAEHLVDNWDLVTDKCYSAKLLEQEICRAFA